MVGYRGAQFLRMRPYFATDIKINSGTNNGTDSDSNNGTDNGTENDANNHRILVYAYNGSVIAVYSSNQSYHVACVTP